MCFIKSKGSLINLKYLEMLSLSENTLEISVGIFECDRIKTVSSAKRETKLHSEHNSNVNVTMNEQKLLKTC